MQQSSDTIEPQFIDFSSATSPVRAVINGTRLSIPRNYVEVAIVQKRSPDTPASERQIGWLRLVTFFPSFSGMTPDLIKTVKASSSTRYPDLIRINILPNDDVWSQGLRKTRQVQSQEASLPTDYGLLSVQQGEGDLFRPVMTEDGEPIAIDRNRASGGSGFCTVDLFRWPHMSVEYEYNGALLDRWKEVDDGVSRLVNSFLEHR